MAMEDAYVLAESLRAHARPLTDRRLTPTRLAAPKVNWVHEQSDAVAQSFRLLPDRDA